MEPSTAVDQSSKLKRAKSADPPSLRKKFSGYLGKQSLKAKFSRHFSREPPVPRIKPEHIRVLRDENGITIPKWQILSSPDPAPSTALTKPVEQGGSILTPSPSATSLTKYGEQDGNNMMTPSPCATSSKDERCYPPKWSRSRAECPEWLSSPTLASPTPPGPYAPVIGTGCFVELPSSDRGDSEMQEIENQCFGYEPASLHRHNETAQSSQGPFSIVGQDEEPFLDRPIQPLRVNKKRESPETNLSSAERDEYYPSVAPLSTPRRRLASNNTKDPPKRNSSLGAHLDYLDLEHPESPLQQRLQEAIFDDGYITSEHPGKLDDHGEEFSESSSCYSKIPGDFCLKHHSKLCSSSGVAADSSTNPFAPEPNQGPSSQVTAKRDLGPHQANAVCYNNPFYSLGQAAVVNSDSNLQAGVSAMEGKKKFNLEASRHRTSSIGSMYVHRDSSTLVPSPEQVTNPRIPPIPGPNIAPLPALSGTESNEEKGYRRRAKTKFSLPPHKRVKEFMGQALHKVGAGFSKLSSKRNKEEDPEEAEVREVAREVQNLINEELVRGREHTNHGARVPKAWIFRDDSGYFNNRSNQITEQATHHAFDEMLM